jgi:flagellar hook-associated protein 3 FlgL
MKNQTNMMGKNLSKASKAMDQISTGKLYTKISDNPTEIARSLTLKSRLNTTKVFEENIDGAISENNVAETAIVEVNSTLQRIREVIVAKTNSAGDLPFESAQIEIESLVGTLVDNLNTEYNGNYLFSGSSTKTKPFNIVDDLAGNPTIVNVGNNDEVKVEIADGVEVVKNIKGEDLYSYDGGTNTLSSTLNKLITDLSNKDASSDDTLLAELSKHGDNILSALTTLGSRTERYENMLETQTNLKYNFQDQISEIEDTDIETAYIDFSQYSMAYEASIAAVQKISQLSLLNILR